MEKGSEKPPGPVPTDGKSPYHIGPVLESGGLGSPDAWLYVSKRLDLQWLPNTPLWAADAITIDRTAYYRLSARVLVWLEAAGEQLQRQHEAGQLERSQLLAYVDAMEVVWGFAREHIAREAVAAARSKPASLPEAPQLK